MAVVVGADGVGDPGQRPWIRRPVREEVDHVQRAIAPGPGKAEAAANRGIVARRTGRAGVEHDKRDAGPVGRPLAPEAVAISPRRVEVGAHSHTALSLPPSHTSLYL